jgi:hypothetical protein
MLCPRCKTPTLDEKERSGITIDVCAQCRGIWLDRGELELLVARASQEMPVQQHAGQPYGHDSHKDHHNDSHDGHDRGHHRKKNWLMEILD